MEEEELVFSIKNSRADGPRWRVDDVELDELGREPPEEYVEPVPPEATIPPEVEGERPLIQAPYNMIPLVPASTRPVREVLPAFIINASGILMRELHR